MTVDASVAVVTVLFFGKVADQLGRQRQVELPAGGCTVADLRAPMRDHSGDDGPLYMAIREALTRKPKGHDFKIERRGERPAVARPMSATGG